ncbi:MAG TPA: hypothetical protein VLT88_09480 [Desulfosarcina sp.]|nr:hypothetical protein [Desulfosarcina sp.]
MKRIVILGDPQRLDPRLVGSLNCLFPECEVHVVDAVNRDGTDELSEDYSTPAERAVGTADPP